MKSTSLTVFLFGMSGCAYFTPPDEQSVFDKYASCEVEPNDWQVRVSALTSKRQAIIVVCGNDHRYSRSAPSPGAADGIAISLQALTLMPHEAHDAYMLLS